MFKKLRVDQITVGVRVFDVADEKIGEICKSLQEKAGQIHPIVVDENYVLICGEARLRAHIRLGLEFIECIVKIDLTEDEKLLMQFDENLCRRQLSGAKLDFAWAESKKVWLRIHPEKQHGGDRRSKAAQRLLIEDPGSFVEDTHERTGLSASYIKEHVKIGEAYTPEERGVLDGVGLNHKELYQLAKLPQPSRSTTVEKIKTQGRSALGPVIPSVRSVGRHHVRHPQPLAHSKLQKAGDGHISTILRAKVTEAERHTDTATPTCQTFRFSKDGGHTATTLNEEATITRLPDSVALTLAYHIDRPGIEATIKCLMSYLATETVEYIVACCTKELSIRKEHTGYESAKTPLTPDTPI
jgi:hypothetical protein